MRACERACVQPLTSSTTETVFRQSLILDWKPDVPGDDRSSFVMTTKSATLILSGMFGARTEPKLTGEERDPKFPSEGRGFTRPLCSQKFGSESSAGSPFTGLKLAQLGARPLRVCVRVEVRRPCARLSAHRGRAKLGVTWECLRERGERS